MLHQRSYADNLVECESVKTTTQVLVTTRIPHSRTCGHNELWAFCLSERSDERRTFARVHTLRRAVRSGAARTLVTHVGR